MKTNIACLMLTLCFFYSVFGEAKQEDRGATRSEFKIDIHNLQRVNGVIDITELKEILLVSVEKTQLTGRFGIVVARIEDLVKIPDFLSFKPVVVIGKLNYKRNGSSYECYIQWEKVCLLTPAFNKVKILTKVLVSKFIVSNVEIPTSFNMKAVGDIPNFVQSVRELFSAPIATSGDFTDKEKEKIADFQKQTLTGDMKSKGEGRAGDRGESKIDSIKGTQKNNEGDRYTGGQGRKPTSSQSNRNSVGGTEDKRKEDAASRNGGLTNGAGVNDAAGTRAANGHAMGESKAGTKPNSFGAVGDIGSGVKDREDAAQVRVPSDGCNGDAAARSGTNGANGGGATNGQSGQNGRQGTNSSAVSSSTGGGRDGRDGTGAPQIRVPGDGRSRDSTDRVGANGGGATNGQSGQNGRQGTNPSGGGSSVEGGRDGREGTGAPQVRVPGDGRAGDPTAQTGTNGANGGGATNGQSGQNGRQGTNPSGGGSSVEGGRDGREGTGAPQIRVPGDGRSRDSTDRVGATGGGATNGQSGQNGRQGTNSSGVSSSTGGGRDGREGTGAPQIRVPGDGRSRDSTDRVGATGGGATNGQSGQNGRQGTNSSAVSSSTGGGREGRNGTVSSPAVPVDVRPGDATARTGADGANRTEATNGQTGQGGRSITNTTTFGAAGWGGRDGNEGSGALQVGAPSDRRHNSSTNRVGANSAENPATETSFVGNGYNNGNDTSIGGYSYERELNNTTSYVGARSSSSQGRTSYNVPEMQLPRVTRIGCTPRVDIDQLRVYEQERLVTMEGGVEVPQPCKDSSVFYTIYKDYNYPYHYDFRQNRAIAQFAYVYTDGTARRKVIMHQGSEVQIDPTRYIIFQETAEGCRPNKKYTDNDTLDEMAKCTKKFFVKPSGEIEFVTGCEETSIRARVKTTREGCEIIHNFGEEKSYYQSRKVYQFPGDRKPTEYEACKPEPTAIRHISVKCNPDIENGKIFERIQIEIDTDTGRKVIRPCQRVSVDGVPLMKEFRGYYLTGTDFNYPYIRKYYMHNNTKNYLDGDEVDFSTRYPSISQTVAYHNEDDKQYSTPILVYTFKDSQGKTQTGLTNVRGTPIKYTDTNVTVIKDLASPEIVGCTKTTKRANYRIWKRQDGTEYFEKLAEVSPLVEHVCRTELIKETPRVVKTFLKFHDKSYERSIPEYDEAPTYITYGTGGTVSIEADGNKTLEEMIVIYRSQINNLRRKYQGYWESYRLVYQFEESTYSVIKRDDEVIVDKKLWSTRTYEEPEITVAIK